MQESTKNLKYKAFKKQKKLSSYMYADLEYLTQMPNETLQRYFLLGYRSCSSISFYQSLQDKYHSQILDAL